MVDFRKKLQEKKAEREPEAAGEPIHLKYRPRELKDVLGQDATTKSLEAALSGRSVPHCYMFTGPAGTGKTTLARIVAARLGCATVEVDAASRSGIDDMRELMQSMQYKGFGETPNRMVIIDECHGLSKQAWDSLLKTTEEPPAHLYFAFCSTNPSKVPAPIVTRCQTYGLKALPRDDVYDLLEDVCKGEGYGTEDSVLGMIVDACEGSARRALTMLAKVHDCADPDEAAALLEGAGDDPEVIDLCRLLVKGDLTWSKLTATLKALDRPPEGVRIQVALYITACLMGARSDSDAVRLLDMLEPFLKPFNDSDKNAPLLAAFGRILFP